MKAEVTKQAYKIPCEVHTCRNRAGYKLGNAKFPHTCFNACEDCMKEIVETLPDELKPVKEVIKEVVVYDFEPEPKAEEGQEESSEGNQEENTEETDEDQDEEVNSSMTMKELKALAEQRGIKIGSKVTKPELLQVLGIE